MKLDITKQNLNKFYGVNEKNQISLCLKFDYYFSNMNANPSSSKSPSDFLKLVLGRPVIVKLNSGVVYKGTIHIMEFHWQHSSHTSLGILACLDGYMNIAMEQTEEYHNDQLRAKYGDAFIRGNNGEE